MRRREFIGSLIGTAVAWPLAASAQQSTMPVIGFLNSGSPKGYARAVAGFVRGLSETGYVEGRSVTIEYRWAEGHYERLPAMAAELVRGQVEVLVATGGNISAQGAREATATIPIVFSATDPVGQGLVASLGRPGGNATGVNLFTAELLPKRLQLLDELVPKATNIAFLVNPASPASERYVKDVEAAAHALGRRLRILNASTLGEIDRSLATLSELRVGALLVINDPFFFIQRDQIVALAARHAVPAIYEWREFAEAGGLMSYGTDIADAYRQVGIYAGRLLKGAKPADLPVVQPAKFELVINLKTAKTLGITIPPSIMVRADEVIE
jgi:putative ABC transport system substrate-binding protein